MDLRNKFTPGVQDGFPQTLVRDRTIVNIFLVNGIRLSGQPARPALTSL
ncbi:LSm family protein [Paraburkholderia terrae]|nr:hypothetical protein [Paraburkholderia terrae]MDW3661902.1 RNA chaperone Hfq [Paraburkholderia terrae]